MFVVALALAIATPAFAEFKLNGYYRAQGYLQQTKVAGVEEPTDQTFVNQRLRMKMTYSLTDRVSFVYYGEVDTDWGENGKGGNDGKRGADSINLETKNAFLNVKFPDSGCNLRLGVQGIKDDFDGVVFFDDMAGAVGTGKLGTADVRLIWSKWNENDRSETDDVDLYGLGVSNKFSDALTLGGGVYYLVDNSDDLDGNTALYAGLNGDVRFGNMAINGFGVFLSQDDETASSDGTGYAATVKGNMKLDNGQLGLRLFYFSEDDDSADNNGWTGNYGAYEFVNENLVFFLVDKYVTDAGKNRYVFTDAVNAGFGAWGAVLSGSFNMPMDMYTKFGLGYFSAVTDDANDDNVGVVDGEGMGFEAAAQVGKKFAEKVDLSLRVAYAGFGDFYKGTAAGNDPDDAYAAIAMIHVPF
ncbi:MAG: hypothetical protein C0617_11640 [Desulfuromonas sp.]|nr:MAG: hypothetical protein C0617_11640 [Desulfuromonas sp.]